MNNISQFNKTPYRYEFPLPNGTLYRSNQFQYIEECVAECKDVCRAYHVNYDDRDVKLFMIDADGKWEVTEEGELAG